MKKIITESFVNTINENKKKAIQELKEIKNSILKQNNPEKKDSKSNTQKILDEDRRITKQIRNKFKININSIYDIVNDNYNYSDDFLIYLTGLIDSVKEIEVKEGIIRVLSCKKASKYAAKKLISEFRSTKNDNYQWACGNALGMMADEDIGEDLISIAEEKKFGRSREMIVQGLGRIKVSKSVDVLTKLLIDGEVCGHAVVALQKLKAKRTKPYLELFVDYPISWIGNAAKKGIENIEKGGTDL